jgi:hypothetical protein
MKNFLAFMRAWLTSGTGSTLTINDEGFNQSSLIYEHINILKTIINVRQQRNYDILNHLR